MSDRESFLEDDDHVNDNDDVSTIPGNKSDIKKYIKKIKSFNIKEELKSWVVESVLNIRRRLHDIDDINIAAFFIKGNMLLNCGYSIDEILSITGTTKYKKKILKLVQQQTTSRDPSNESDVIVPIIITSPIQLISYVVSVFTDENEFSCENIYSLIRDIEHFATIMYECDEELSIFLPKCCACAFVYFYLSNFSSYTGKKKSFLTKTFFKNLKFSDGNKMGNVKDFDNSIKRIEENYKSFLNVCESKEELLKFIYFS